MAEFSVDIVEVILEKLQGLAFTYKNVHDNESTTILTFPALSRDQFDKLITGVMNVPLEGRDPPTTARYKYTMVDFVWYGYCRNYGEPLVHNVSEAGRQRRSRSTKCNCKWSIICSKEEIIVRGSHNENCKQQYFNMEEFLSSPFFLKKEIKVKLEESGAKSLLVEKLRKSQGMGVQAGLNFVEGLYISSQLSCNYTTYQNWKFLTKR